MMKVSFYTLGCKVNQYETQEMTEILRRCGYEPAADGETPDVCVVNSCTVTAESDRKTRQAVNRMRRLYPESIIVLAGCMAQAYPEKSDELPSADIVLGNRDYSRLPEVLEEYRRSGKHLFRVLAHEKGERFCDEDISAFENRNRAFVKIQDGCDRFCAYCIIPTSRGRSRSKPLEELKPEFERLAQAGFTEVVLVGINLSAYGRDIGSDICAAVESAAAVDGIAHVRLGSLEPDHITPEILDRLAACPKFCPQFHISLQSGCDDTLKRMNRHYTAAEYAQLCADIRARFDDPSITTDLMVGFAGETAAEFEETCAFVRKIRFDKVHVFPYSVRPGTRAEHFENHVPKAEKERRARVMIDLTEAIRAEKLKERIGKTDQVLFESRHDGDCYTGYTSNYTPVQVRSEHDISGQTLAVRITGADAEKCMGELL